MDAPEQLVEKLTYANFRHNALNNPNTKFSKWEKVYGTQTKDFIKRLRKEIANN